MRFLYKPKVTTLIAYACCRRLVRICILPIHVCLFTVLMAAVFQVYLSCFPFRFSCRVDIAMLYHCATKIVNQIPPFFQVRPVAAAPPAACRPNGAAFGSSTARGPTSTSWRPQSATRGSAWTERGTSTHSRTGNTIIAETNTWY